MSDKGSFLKNIFSITNSQDRKHKIVTLFGVKFKLKKYIKYNFAFKKNKKKNILLISHDLTKTGAPLMLFDCAEILLEKYNIYCWSIGDGPLSDSLKENEIEHIVLNQVDYHKINKYYKEMKKFDFIIVNTIVCDFFANICYKYSLPYMWYIHETEISKVIKPKFHKFQKILQNNENNIYVVSEFAQKYYKDTYCINSNVLNCFVKDEYRQRKNKINDKIKFLFVGTIDKNKGLDVLCNAFNKLEANYKDKCELNVMGNFFKDNYAQEIKEICKDNTNIHFLGTLYNLKRLDAFEENNVFVVPSLNESSSRVTLEACMMGRPVIVTENVGAKYMITHDNGWIVKTGSDDAIKDCIKHILNAPDRLVEMGKCARQKYLETSTREIYANNLLSIIQNNLKIS